ncbi:hypothetical protein [Prosthecobacter sp.]|uniref:hypothetical protein n=1 Tax=Prosthecobacter sp. TaxID=1965333 RepID=UPI002AB98598|nr:hypothetical protein [Prosthecobacter sp.]MDZ4403971.1 hypothetical protein [Prosthecobacter sp.]
MSTTFSHSLKGEAFSARYFRRPPELTGQHIRFILGHAIGLPRLMPEAANVGSDAPDRQRAEITEKCHGQANVMESFVGEALQTVADAWTIFRTHALNIAGKQGRGCLHQHVCE